MLLQMIFMHMRIQGKVIHVASAEQGIVQALRSAAQDATQVARVSRVVVDSTKIGVLEALADGKQRAIATELFGATESSVFGA